ncbi:MAG TPA: phosphatidylserine decarboxylase, partial [Geminicoccaceae bacterium]|nr:phosphatidylserine decarboxylase [Geminicoccaceae bacterium]
MQLPEHIRQAIVPIHRAGWPFIGAGLVLAVLLGLLAAPLFWLGLLVTAWMVYFFRDPPRVSPQGDEIVVSPADGVVQAIAERRPPPEM